jgi:hypothetical protein
MEKRYGALRVIGTIYKVLGFLAAAFTILTALALCATSVLGGAAMGNLGRDLDLGPRARGLMGGVVGGLVGGVVSILWGGGLAVTLYAMGEGVYLLLALEENTRATMNAIQRQASVQAPPPPSG